MRKDKRNLAKEDKVRQKLIDSIRALTNYRMYTLGQIEKTLGMPENSLSGMLNGSRNMSPKWQTLLAEFIKALPKEDKTITIKIGEVEPEPVEFPLLTQAKALAAELTRPPQVEKVVPPPAADRKLPPPGLSKTQLQRWYRENSQTLK